MILLMVTRMSMKVQEMILVDGEEGMSSHQFIACMHVYGLTYKALYCKAPQPFLFDN